MDVSRIINIVAAGLGAYGLLVIFQGGFELAGSHKQQRQSDGSQWWQIVEGVMCCALAALLATIISPILSA